MWTYICYSLEWNVFIWRSSFDGKVTCSLFFCILMQILIDDILLYIQVFQCINLTSRFVIEFSSNDIIERFANLL
jgi:hypothetical protein